MIESLLRLQLALELDTMRELRELATELTWTDEQFEQTAAERFGIQMVHTTPSSTIFESYLSTLTMEQQDIDQLTENVHHISQLMQTKISLTSREQRPGYGLVVGRIQSGKTANIVGTVANFIDSTTRMGKSPLVILLTGLIEDLRIQTYHRVSTGLAGVAVLPSEDGDIGERNQQTMDEIIEILSTRDALVLAIKKEHRVLTHLTELLERLPANVDRYTLIIDDECDHASIDSGHAESSPGQNAEDITATNHAVRRLIQLFNRGDYRPWYIGFTATPFSNLLMEANPEFLLEQDLGLSLYPRDFMFLLPKPTNHFGNEEFFSDNAPYVRELVTPDENSQSEMDHILKLVLLHVVSFAVRFEQRGTNSFHHTSMVHTATEMGQHARVVGLLQDAINFLHDLEEDQLIGRMVEACGQEYPEKVSILNSAIARFRSSRLFTVNSLFDESKLAIVKLNSDDIPDQEFFVPQELNYNGPGWFNGFVVGGQKLSRGFTIENLVITWFARDPVTPRYDSMMQMSRWCGFRGEIHELIRIFLPPRVREIYVDINNAVDEVYRRLETSSNPLNEVMWIRERHDALVSGQMPDNVIRRPSNQSNLISPMFLINNHTDLRTENHARNLILFFFQKWPRLHRNSTRLGEYFLTRDVSSDLAHELISSCQYGRNRDIRTIELLNIIEQNPQLPWNLAVFSPEDAEEFGGLGLSSDIIYHDERVSRRRSDRVGIIDIGPSSRTQPLMVIEFLNPRFNSQVGINHVFESPIPFIEVHLPPAFVPPATNIVGPPDAFERGG